MHGKLGLNTAFYWHFRRFFVIFVLCMRRNTINSTSEKDYSDYNYVSDVHPQSVATWLPRTEKHI